MFGNLSSIHQLKYCVFSIHPSFKYMFSIFIIGKKNPPFVSSLLIYTQQLKKNQKSTFHHISLFFDFLSKKKGSNFVRFFVVLFVSHILGKKNESKGREETEETNFILKRKTIFYY